jgi:hypothetical protein
MYIINDIENLVLLNDMRVFPHLKASCGDIVIREGVDVVEIEIEYYEYCETNRARLIELGDGDISSIYHALKSGNIIITGNNLIAEIASEFSIDTVGIEDFVKSHIKDGMTIDLFNQLKIA